MRAIAIGLIALFFLQANAQVKEINFLGNEWYLVGYDFRIKVKTHSPHFYSSLFLNSEFPSDDYKAQFDFDGFYAKRDIWRNFNTVSAGLVFRPFYYSKLKFIKQIEIAHNVGVEYHTEEFNSIMKSSSENHAFYNSLNLGYNPRIILSSPTVAEYLKFYVAGDAYGYVPFSGTLYTQPDSRFLPNGAPSYKKGSTRYTDRISTNTLNFGAGITAGIKMNLDCKWNFHIEGNAIDMYSRHIQTKHTSQSGIYGIQLGLRYKFGIPTESDSEESNESASPVFW